MTYRNVSSQKANCCQFAAESSRAHIIRLLDTAILAVSILALCLNLVL